MEHQKGKGTATAFAKQNCRAAFQSLALQAQENKRK